MSANQSTPPAQPEESTDQTVHPGTEWRRPAYGLWTLTFAFTAFDEAHAHTVAQHASRRLASVLPSFDKNAIAIASETDPYRVIPVYCDNDIHCALAPEHPGPCRDQTGADLDKLDYARDGVPTFGAEL